MAERHREGDVGEVWRRLGWEKVGKKATVRDINQSNTVRRRLEVDIINYTHSCNFDLARVVGVQCVWG